MSRCPVLDQAEPLDDNGLCVAENPIGIARLLPDEVGDIAPERDVVSPPLRRVGEPLTLIVRDVVTHQVQRDDGRPRRLEDPMRAALVVDQRQSLPHFRQRVT